MRGIDDLMHLLVDEARGLFRVAAVGLHISAEENRIIRFIRDQADALAHAPFGDHLADDFGDALKIVGSTGGNILDDQLFRDAAAEQLANEVEQFRLGDVVVVAVRAGHRIAGSHAAADDGDLLNGIAVFAKFGDDCMAALVIGSDALIRFGDEAALLLRTEQHLIDALEQLAVADHLFIGARGEDGGLVEQIFEVRPRKAAGHAREDLEVDVWRERFVARVHL